MSSDWSLRLATHADFAFCESLSRSNMSAYRDARSIAWDPKRFLASWAQFENFAISDGARPIGVMRLFAFDDVLEIRDLQVVPARQRAGVGRWAIERAIEMGRSRGVRELRLRVYPENPARALYARMGFASAGAHDGVEHMALALVD
ncbi:MAG TPA: GNAT family N-acetyltransferase [Xanthomonadales bacterium]|nr:GNAT family N-acetyltransferase [Xanthomonadales bacterium]